MFVGDEDADLRVKWVSGGTAVAIACVVIAWHSREAAPRPAGTMKSMVTLGRHRYAWENILESAKEQAAAHTGYDASYVQIAYPEGDVPIDRGACTDVIVRALRHAGYDLQALIHEDMKAHLKEYPRHGVAADTNIDHRRVPNQMYFFKKFGETLPTAVSAQTLATWKAGDFVYWKPDGGEHTGIVSDDLNKDGIPLVIHNWGGCQEEDCLTRWPIIGHYRFPTGAPRVNSKT